MKKFSLLILLISQSIFAQNILWEQVGLKVEEGKATYVLELIDDYYNSFKLPEGVSISLDAIWFKPEGFEATHYLSFSGSLEALAKLKDLRSGDAYDAYNGEINKFAKITSISSGSTINRWNVSKGNDPISQLWQWNVNDPEIFVTEFMKLVKGFPQEGYLSIGLISQGTGTNGESHYVYTTHKDYAAAISWGPKTKKQQESFVKFQQLTNPISSYLGTITMNRIKSWN